MNTSDVVNPASRPLLTAGRSVYRPEPKDVLFTKLKASLRSDPKVSNTPYDTSLFEFPGDRTYSRRVDRG